jgi:hypothetical protein
MTKEIKKEDLLKVTGEEMPCARNCKIGHQCSSGWKSENDVCDKNIRIVKEKLFKMGYISETVTREFFGVRVFDHNSKNLPFPPLGDILIKDGKLFLR